MRVKSSCWSILILALLAESLLAESLLAYRQDSQTYKIIVHIENPATTITKKELKNIFLKRTVRWPDGQKILPVDLGGESRARALFTRDIHNKNVSSVRAYWQKKIFSGKGVPPAIFENEAEVLAYVSNQPGTIGYVLETTQGEGFKVLVVVP